MGKETFYYIIKESELTNEVFDNGYLRTKEGVIHQVVPFTKNKTFKEEHVYTLEGWVNFGFDEKLL